ncbi:MAG: hypothetical protein WCH01_17500 [Methylococcaceae bacterium]
MQNRTLDERDAECRLWVVTGRPEIKNLLVANGCFGMILTGFMNENTHL